MAKLSLVDNPFNPGTATRPAYLAGRHEERGLIEKTLARIANLHKLKKKGSPYPSPLTPIKIVGTRGVGKTTLLATARRMAEEMKIHVLPIAHLQNLAERELLAGLIGDKAYDNLKAKLSQVRSLSAGPVGVTVEPEDIGLAQTFRKKMKKQPLLLLMDEVMHYDPHALGEMLQICQTLINEEYPLAVIMAGTPRLDQLLERVSASFINRSNKIYINALSDNETLKALSKPFEQNKIKVEPVALQHMAKLTDNYPYFTQIVGAHVWDAMLASSKRQVGLALVRGVETKIQISREDFYSEIRSKMISADLMKHAGRAMEILRQNQGKALIDTVISGLGNTPIDSFKKKYIDIFNKLKDLGFIWEQRGWVEAGIPSFFDYCQQKAKEAAKSNNG